MSWNVKAGGFDAYDPTLELPTRGKAIKDVIDRQYIINGVRTVGLVDAYRWDEVYKGEEGIARHLGFNTARFTRLNDKRLGENGAGIGIAFATDMKIRESEILDLGTRCCLRVVLDVGPYGIQCLIAYLNDLSEDARLGEARAIKEQLDPNVPTALFGDINALRPSMRGASIRNRLGDFAVRTAALLLPSHMELGESIQGMNRREVVPYIESCGYVDADREAKRPTAPVAFPAFGIDYVFTNDRARVTSFNVLPPSAINGASDHLPLVFDVEAVAP